jgi:imidazolonepropionase-like amidohydrolase
MTEPQAGRFDFAGVGVAAPLTRPVAITGATVIPMDREVRLAGHTVVVDGGVIRTVAPDAAVDTFGMDVVDGAGRFLVPGLADMHCHPWELSSALAYIANGVTMVRNMSGSSFHLAWRRAVEQGRLPGPHLVTTGPLIDGAGPTGGAFWPGFIPLTDPAAAPAVINAQAQRGYNQIKTYSFLRPDVLAAVGAAARSAGVPMGGHCPDGMTDEDAIDAGMTFFEHFQRITAGHGHDADPDLSKIRKLARRLHAEQLWNCPTMIITESYYRDPLPEADAEWRRYASPVSRLVADRTLGPLRSAGEWGQFKAAMATVNQARLKVLGVLAEEDAPLLVGTDAPVPNVPPGFSVHGELSLFTEAGLSPYRALRAATTDAARFLGQDEIWGTVAPGRRADLVLVDRDPLRDLAALRQPRMVMVNGFAFDRADLDNMLARRAELVGDQRSLAGGLRHMAGSCCIGRLRHQRTGLEGGLIQIEEDDEAAEWRREARLILAPTGTVRSFTIGLSNGLGTETCTVEELPAGGYTWEACDLDGHSERGEIAAAGLLPDPGLALTGTAEIPNPNPEPRPSLAVHHNFFFPGLVAGRPVVRSLKIRHDDTSPSTWLVDDGTPMPAAPWADPVVPPTIRLSVAEDGQVTAIRGTDFLRLGEYVADDEPR